MDEYKDNNAKGPKGVNIYDRKHSKWSNQPRSVRLPYRNAGEKASDFHCDAMGKGCYFHQPQKFVNYDDPDAEIKPRSIPSMYDSDVNERCCGRQLDRDRIDSRDQGLKVTKLPSRYKNLSTVSIQSCTTPLPFITPQTTSKEKLNPTKYYRYSYQRKRPSTSFGRSHDDDEDDEHSSARYDRVWTPKERYGNWIPLNWSSRNSSDHSPNELCSTKT